MSNQATSFEHNGHTVTLTADFTFEVAGPAFEGKKGYFDTISPSADEARRAIDGRVKTLAQQKKATEKITIHAIDDMGEPCTIRGINANTGELLGVPKGRNSTRRNIFPPVPWLIAAVKRWREFDYQTEIHRQALEPYRIQGSRGYERISAYEYDTLIANFQTEFATKEAKAVANTPKEVTSRAARPPEEPR